MEWDFKIVSYAGRGHPAFKSPPFIEVGRELGSTVHRGIGSAQTELSAYKLRFADDSVSCVRVHDLRVRPKTNLDAEIQSQDDCEDWIKKAGRAYGE